MLVEEHLLSWTTAAGVTALTLLALYVPTILSFRFDIPGPLLARFTNLWYWWQLKKGNFHDTSIDLHRKKGSIIKIAPNYYSVSDVDALKTIYGHGSKFSKAEWYKAWGLRETQTNLFSEQSHTIHAATRRKVASMYSMSSLVSYEPFVDNCNTLFRGKLKETAAHGQYINLAHRLQYYAFDVIGEITYGKRFGFLQEGKDIEGMIQDLDQRLTIFTYVGLFMWLKPFVVYVLSLGENGRSFIVQFMMKRFTETKQRATAAAENNEPICMSMKFLQAQQANPENFTDSDVIASSASNVGAGSDTTAISLSSVIYYLYKSPTALQKLREELTAADLGERPRFKDVQGLPYLQAVIKESMRLHPAVGLPLFRTVPAGGAVIAGKYFSENTAVGINAWVMHRNPDVFGDDVDEFIPERWIDANEKRAKLMEQCFMPFGLGSRTCIGKNISLLEINKLVPTLVRDFDFEFSPEVERRWDVRNRWFVKPMDFKAKVVPRC